MDECSHTVTSTGVDGIRHCVACQADVDEWHRWADIDFPKDGVTPQLCLICGARRKIPREGAVCPVHHRQHDSHGWYWCDPSGKGFWHTEKPGSKVVWVEEEGAPADESHPVTDKREKLLWAIERKIRDAGHWLHVYAVRDDTNALMRMIGRREALLEVKYMLEDK